jgi:hypothetical protein
MMRAARSLALSHSGGPLSAMRRMLGGLANHRRDE